MSGSDGCGLQDNAAGNIVLAARSASFIEVFNRIAVIPDAGGTYCNARRELPQISVRVCGRSARSALPASAGDEATPPRCSPHSVERTRTTMSMPSVTTPGGRGGSPLTVTSLASMSVSWPVRTSYRW